MTKLTKKQKLLLNEIKEITEMIGIDYQGIESQKSEWGEYLSVHLERVKDHLVRSAVVMDYALLDEHLNSLISHCFFGKKKGFIKLWKTKKFKNFNYYILENL